MSIVEPLEALYSINARKRIGRQLQYGRGTYGIDLYGLGRWFYGIYQQRRCKTGRKTIKMRFYSPINPKTPAQLIEQARFRAAVAAWQDLTSEEKLIYNRRAVGLHMTGFNLYMREFVLPNN